MRVFVENAFNQVDGSEVFPHDKKARDCYMMSQRKTYETLLMIHRENTGDFVLIRVNIQGLVGGLILLGLNAAFIGKADTASFQSLSHLLHIPEAG